LRRYCGPSWLKVVNEGVGLTILCLSYIWGSIICIISMKYVILLL
jgi:hypothetical protein